MQSCIHLYSLHVPLAKRMASVGRCVYDSYQATPIAAPQPHPFRFVNKGQPAKLKFHGARFEKDNLRGRSLKCSCPDQLQRGSVRHFEQLRARFRKAEIESLSMRLPLHHNVKTVVIRRFAKRRRHRRSVALYNILRILRPHRLQT